MRALAPEFAPYAWAASTAEVARLAGIDPSEVLRFDQNTPPLPLPSTRPGTIAGGIARVSSYPADGYLDLRAAIARYTGVEPENVVVGAGADDLILLCARAWAGSGDSVAIPPEPTYPLYRIAAQLAGATVGGPDPVVTFACRPNNPTGALCDLPEARPLVVDEAYYEYAGVTALPLIDDGDVVVLRTFSKSFALAGARVGYALAAPDLAAELNARQAPAPVSSLSVDVGARRIARAAERRGGHRGARAPCRRAACARARPAAVGHELPLRPRRRRPRARRCVASPRPRRAGVRRRDPSFGARRRGRRRARRDARTDPRPSGAGCAGRTTAEPFAPRDR